MGALAGLLLDDGSQGPVYVAGDDGQWHHIPDADTANAMGIDWNSITWYGQLPGSIGDELPPLAPPAPAPPSPPPPTATPVATQPTPAAQPSTPTTYGGALAGLLLPDGTQGPVYVAGDDGAWHHIPDVTTANAMGIDWQAITWYGQLPGSIGDELPSLQPPGVNPTQPTNSITTTATLAQPSSSVNPAQPTPGESTPGDWTPWDTQPVQPTTTGTPIPSGSEQSASTVQSQYSYGLESQYQKAYGLGPLGNPQAYAELARLDFAELFPFAGGKDDFSVGDVMYLNVRVPLVGGLISAPIKVVSITPTSFTFEAIKWHVEGGWFSWPPGEQSRTITFAFGESAGQNTLRVSTAGTGSLVTDPPFSYLDFPWAKFEWHEFADTLSKTYYWNHVIDVSPRQSVQA